LYVAETNGFIRRPKSIVKDWHTPHELYEHRYTLFRALVFGTHRLRSWRSLQHHDGSMFKDSFIVGINLLEGPITYHLPMSWWHKFDGITEYERAPEWDGCGPEQGLVRLNNAIDRLQLATSRSEG
jgi:hypothetical protein